MPGNVSRRRIRAIARVHLLGLAMPHQDHRRDLRASPRPYVQQHLVRAVVQECVAVDADAFHALGVAVALVVEDDALVEAPQVSLAERDLVPLVAVSYTHLTLP